MIPTRLKRLVENTLNFQDIKKEFHPEPNVNNHLGQVATLAIKEEESWNVVMACVLHDIAKNTTNPKKWAQHAYRGALLIACDVPEPVRWLVENHMRAISYAKGEMKAHKRKFLEEHPFFEELMRLHKYDTDGREAHGNHFAWPVIYGYLDACDTRPNEVVVMIGIQAVGKSTIAKAYVESSRDHMEWWKPKYEHTSKDDIRLLFGHGPGAWRHQESCIHELQQQAIRMALGRGQAVVIDNCHNTIKRRRDALEWLRAEFPGLHVKAHLVYAPLDVCIYRNREEHGSPNRHRLLIPDKVLAQFHGDLVAGIGKIGDDSHIEKKLLEEGFDSVTITRTA